jgi:hypothetical protein
MFIKEGKNNEIAKALEILFSGPSSFEQQKIKEKDLSFEEKRTPNQSSKED